MSEFTALRMRARDRRDREISKARADYEVSLRQIAELEQRLLGKFDPTKMPLSAAVERVIPRDTPFSITDVMHALEALDPSRVWRMQTVRRQITFLRERGLLRRVAKHTVNQPASYVRCETPQQTVADKTLRQIVCDVVTRPMYIAEVVHAVLEAGYKTTMRRKDSFRTHVIRELRAAGFREQGGKWQPV